MARQYPEVLEAMIQQREKELDALWVAYQDSRNSLVGGTEVLKLYRLAASYRAGEPADKAVYILAQVAMLLGTLAAPALVVEAYETKEKSLNELKAGRSVPEAS
jgi:hypothetical protein